MSTDSSWVHPFWLERQTDPSGPDFIPGDAAYVNLTHRSGTLMGNVSTAARSLVDTRGLVTPFGSGWSIDWWIGAEDRWHLPSREKVVRQHLVADAPVVETAMRVPGGDAVHRVYAMHHAGVGPCAMIEIENRTAVPFAVAIALRPFDNDGRAVMSAIDGSGAAVVVNDRHVVTFSREPARVACSTMSLGDAAAIVFAGDAPEPGADGWQGVRDAQGGATAAFIFPLPHTAMLRVAIALSVVPSSGAGRSGAPGRSPRRSRAGDPLAAFDPGALRFPDVVPSAAQVAKGWEAQSRRGLTVEVPDDRLQHTIDASRRHLLVAHRGDDMWRRPGTALDLGDAGIGVGALDLFGFSTEARQVISCWSGMQSLAGAFDGTPGRADSNGAVLDAVAAHWRLTHDAELVAEMIGPIAKGVRWIERARPGRRRRRSQPMPTTTGEGAAALEATRPGVLPPGSASHGTDPADVHFRYAALSVRGLFAIAAALDAAGQPEVSADSRRFAASLRADLDLAIASSLIRSDYGDGDGDGDGDGEGDADEAPDLDGHGYGSRPARRAAAGVIPAAPCRPVDDGIVENLDLALPLGILPGDSGAMAATLDSIRTSAVVDSGVLQRSGSTGFSPALTMRLALVELECGDRHALDRLTWILDNAGATVSWPTSLHPRTGHGATGVAHDPVATALFLTFVRRLLVREVGEIRELDQRGAGPGLALCSMVPHTWMGQPIDVRDAPTAFGRCSFSVRWHGERPALLWELAPHDGIDPTSITVTITAPGLDPDWSSTALQGEALLAAVGGPHLDLGGSFS